MLVKFRVGAKGALKLKTIHGPHSEGKCLRRPQIKVKKSSTGRIEDPKIKRCCIIY